MRDVRLGQQDMLMRYLPIYVVEVNDAGRVTHIQRGGVAGGTWEAIDDTERQEPTLSLDMDAARALLGRLSTLFDGGEDTRSLRRDYDAERKRVDLLVGALVGVATPMLTVNHG